MAVKKILVIGSGLMGRGIAQVSAQSGFTTVLSDVEQSQIDAAMKLINKLLEKDVAKGKKTQEQAEATLKNLTTTTGLDFAAEADYIIEAITENIDIKKKVFQTCDEKAPAHTVIGSNTSSIPITELAACTKRPAQVIGIHFMNPVPVMKLVEIVKGYQTSEATLATTQDVCKAMGKETIVVERDFAGFVVNRICVPLINEAIWLLHDGMGTVEDIDKGVRLGLNHPMGPLTLGDFVGLDTCLYILDIMYKSYGDPKYRACPLLRQMVQAGDYGVKSGKGFYDHTKK
jgi:3-hydroxybutyryl-CoA dehydrogenase